MTVRPLLLLDVDGPLNPFRSLSAGLRGYTSHRMRPDVWLSYRDPDSRKARRGARVRLHPSHGARLQALPFELTWATAWTHQANTMIAPHIGLPGDLPVIDWPELFARDPEGLSWKTRPLVEWAAGRPFAWVDDMITPSTAPGSRPTTRRPPCSCASTRATACAPATSPPSAGGRPGSAPQCRERVRR